MIFTEGFDFLSFIVICKFIYNIFFKKLFRRQLLGFCFFLPVLMGAQKLKLVAEVLY